MAAVPDSVLALAPRMADWRQRIHAWPELGFEEERTSALVAEVLRGLGLEVHAGLGGTGVVAVIDSGRPGPSIGLRADMDALPMEERTDVPYRSTVPGRMHGCGHDGHVTMLLGAARSLVERGNFRGTVHFIFQPGEEMAGGGKVMVDEGLFEKFPVDSVYGMHSWPNLPLGWMSIRPGPGMASAGTFELRVKGKASHAAAPHQGVDPIVAGSAIVTALQTISARITNPTHPIVVSVTQFHAGGEAINSIPEGAVLRGTARSYAADAETWLPAQIRRIAEGVAQGYGCTAELDYQHRYPVLVNAERESQIAFEVASEIVGADRMDREYPPTMASEDFAFMMNARPGCFVRLGSSAPDRPVHALHSNGYDFNDAALPIGVSFWVRLVETVLRK